MKRVLSGVLAIAHTPLTEDDRIDEAALRRSIDWAFGPGPAPTSNCMFYCIYQL